MKFSDYKLQALKNKKVLITGASSGIGKAIAFFLAESGAELYLVARREQRLVEIYEQLKELTLVNFLALDINDSKSLSIMKEQGFFEVDVLINNAGLAIGKSFVGSLENADITTMIETNLVSAIKITNQCLPNMINQKSGNIVNICSIAGHESYAGGSVYCATKHALKAFSGAVRKENYDKGIRVINVSPGMVETEFSEVRFQDKKKAKEVYQGMVPLNPYDIAYQIINALKVPKHVNIDELIIMASAQGSATSVFRS
jgi:NADP-dependent 3-hydroxy acid dehydrogenase YdfG